MGLWNVIAGGVVAWLMAFGWYHRYGAARIAAGGTAPSRRRRALAAGPALLGLILVAGFLRHVFFVAGLTSNLPLAAVAGLGVGLFFIAPWLVVLNLLDARPFRVTLIDGGYAMIATAAMGALLVAF